MENGIPLPTLLVEAGWPTPYRPRVAVEPSRAWLRLGIRTDVGDGEVWADAAFGPVRREPLRVPNEDKREETPPPTAPLHRYVSLFNPERGATLFIATALAVARAGAVPVLVDCDPDHLLIDVAQARRKIGPRTRAVVPVHLYGQMAPMEELASLGLVLVEDAAQAQGATRRGRGPAAVAVAAATSFYPGKNLGAYGDAGALLTNDEAVARRARALRNYGSEAKYVHPETGFNSRLDPLQAVVLSAKLAHLARWNAERRDAARRYAALLAGVPGVVLPATLPGNEAVWHLYVVQVPRRDDVLAKLRAAGIEAGVHYPTPIHLQGAFRALGHRPGDFPVAEAAAARVLSLPIYPGITPAQQERVADALRTAIG